MRSGSARGDPGNDGAMATVGRPGAGSFARKRGKQLTGDDVDGQSGLRRAVGALDLTALGIGAIIGTGIFVIIGEAIGDSGPGDRPVASRSPGITCVFSALSYSELASAIPVSGSAYTYSYATLGELVAWIIGWDLILEYGFSVAAIAVGWGGYLNDLLDSRLRHHAARRDRRRRPATAARSTCPPRSWSSRSTCLLLAGVRESARTNTVMVAHQARRSCCSSSSSASPRFTRRPLHAVRPARHRRHRRRRRADLLRLHRLRRGLDRRRGGREPAARPADRDHRLARASRPSSTSSSRSSPSALAARRQAGRRRRAAGRRAAQRRRPRRWAGGRHRRSARWSRSRASC